MFTLMNDMTTSMGCVEALRLRDTKQSLEAKVIALFAPPLWEPEIRDQA